jgi:prepilin-type N-terminal cleavage/methylation domain-containing protein
MKAFTLVELLVGIGIISMIAGLSLSSYPRFAEQVALTSEVYKILAYAKETQIFGTSAFTTPGTRIVYSLKMHNDSNTIGRYILEDPASTDNQSYVEDSVQDMSTEVFNLKDQYKISLIEGISKDATTTLTSLYIFYKRPNPEGRIVGLVDDTNTTDIRPDIVSGSFFKAIVTIESRRNSAFKKKIVILQTGQAYVEDW